MRIFGGQMKSHFILLHIISVSLFLIVLEKAQALKNLSNNPLQVALIDGKKTDAYPAVGKLVFNNGGYCTATLIAPNFILTAAHCVIDPDTFNKPFLSRCGGGGPEGSFSGDLKLSAKFVINVSGAVHTYSAVWGISYGSNVGASDVGLIMLANQIPLKLVQPMPLLSEDPKLGEATAIVGFGCQKTKWSDECNAYVDGGGKLDGKKQIVYRFFGTPAYQSCPGDSGGPWFRLKDKGIYRVTSGAASNRSTEERRRSNQSSTVVGNVQRYHDLITATINEFSESCSNARFKNGKIEFKVGKCMSKKSCISEGSTFEAGNCPNSSASVVCCSDSEGYIFKSN